MSKNLPSGIGETLGDTLVVNSPLFMSGSVWYVDSENADSDDTAAHGGSKVKPFLTLVYAISQAVAGDTIVLLDGHNESLVLSGDVIDVSKRLIIVGSGAAGGEPTVELTAASGTGTALMALTVAGSEIRNVKFTAFAVDDTAAQLDVRASDCRIIGCVFEADGNHSGGNACCDIDTALTTLVRGCTFRSTATVPTNRPRRGLRWTGGVLWLEDCVFDDGDNGYSEAAFDHSGTGQLVAEGVSLLNGAVARIQAGAGWHFSAPTQTNGAQIQEYT